MANNDEPNNDDLSEASSDFVNDDWDLEPDVATQDINCADTQSDTAVSEQHQKIRVVVECLKLQNMKLDEFLEGLFWGNRYSIADSVTRRCRTEFTASTRLPIILDSLHTPPHYTGALPEAAKSTLNRWAWKHVTREARDEMAALAQDAREQELETNSDLNVETIGHDVLANKALEKAPKTTRFLTLIGETKAQARARNAANSENTEALEPSFAAVMNVHSLAFRFAARCNQMQKLLSLYFRAKHVPKALFSLFHKCGYVMSYSWSLGAIKSLTKDALGRMVEAVENHAVFWIYDNLRLSEAIKSQRGDHHTVTDNGTAMTVVEIPDSVKHIFMAEIPEDTDLDNLAPPPQHDHATLSWDDFMDLDRLTRLADYTIHSLVSILFDTIAGLEDCDLRCHEALQPPAARAMMPSGKEHKTRYHMLGTVPYDESTIGGNIQAIKEMVIQQHLNTEQNQKILGLGLRKFPTVGDQMTYDRLYAAKSLRVRDKNGFNRLDFVVVVPGWFHILMNLGMSTFESFRGSDKTMSFIRDISLLGRSGFTMNMRKQRPEFHTNDEFLRHKLNALVRSLWMHYLDCDTVEKLVEKFKKLHPATIHTMSKTMYHERISSGALIDLANQLDVDEVLQNTILQTRDLMQYNLVRTAIQTGNVGLLEDLLPNLVIYFKGRDNYNYAQTLAETMRWMRHEAPPGMSDAIRDHVWLVNTSGRANGFYESDRLQEFNNGKKKEFGPPPQTTTWQSHKEIAPAIPILGQIAEYVEDNLFDFKRTKVHKPAPMELDVSRLATRHLTAKIHAYNPGRKLEKKADIAEDYAAKGTQAVRNSDWLSNLATNRDNYTRLASTEQKYDLESEESTASNSSNEMDLDKRG